MRVWSVLFWALLAIGIFVDAATVHRRVKRSDVAKIIDGVKGVGHLLGIRSDKILKKGSKLLAKISERPIVGKVVSHILSSKNDSEEEAESKEEETPKVTRKPKYHRKSFEEYANMEEDEWAELKKSERRRALHKYPKLAKLHDPVEE